MRSSSAAAASAPSVIGVDIGKDVFHLVAFTADGEVAFRKKIKRLALADTFRALAPCVVGMEACLSAHFVSRTLRALGHEPRIIPAIYVRPFIKGQKNDYNDAEAIAEAALRPNLRTVREKTQAELDLQAYHRIDRAWCRAARRRSTRSGPSSSSTASQCGRGLARCASRCSRSSSTARGRSRRAWPS
jgi:transposase